MNRQSTKLTERPTADVCKIIKCRRRRLCHNQRSRHPARTSTLHSESSHIFANGTAVASKAILFLSFPDGIDSSILVTAFYLDNKVNFNVAWKFGTSLAAFVLIERGG
jgi:hypothetical protein